MPTPLESMRIGAARLQAADESLHVDLQESQSRLKRFGVWQRDGYNGFTREKIPDS